MANSYRPPKDTTNRRKIRSVFMRFYGSGAWAAATLGVKRPTISQWLRGKKASTRLDAEMPRLAQRLLDTDGECIRSVRSQIARLRRKP